MTPDQFRQLTSLQQIELLFDQGREFMSRIFVFYNIDNQSNKTVI